MGSNRTFEIGSTPVPVEAQYASFSQKLKITPALRVRSAP